MPDLVSRSKFESRLADTLNTVFAAYQLRIQELLSSFDTTLGDLKTLPPSLYQELQADLTQVLKAALMEAYIEAFTSFDGHLADSSSRVARRGALFIRENAQEWADFYAPRLAKDIANVTENKLRAIADRSPQLPISGLGLRNFIHSLFGRGRSLLIARTELTNVISTAEQAVVDEFPEVIKATLIWYTKLDERVCIICEPRHGREQGVNWELPPPAHPRCRCEVKWRVEYPDGRVIEVRSLEEVQLGKSQVIEV